MQRPCSFALVLFVAVALLWTPMQAARSWRSPRSPARQGPPGPALAPSRTSSPHVTTTCDVGEKRLGCRIHLGLCVCGIGCRNEYQYSDKQECTNALTGKGRNLCGEAPCQHGGGCSQTTVEPGYKCSCEGTGFYGPRCEYECPRPGTRSFPRECILI